MSRVDRCEFEAFAFIRRAGGAGSAIRTQESGSAYQQGAKSSRKLAFGRSNAIDIHACRPGGGTGLIDLGRLPLQHHGRWPGQSLLVQYREDCIDRQSICCMHIAVRFPGMPKSQYTDWVAVRRQTMGSYASASLDSD